MSNEVYKDYILFRDKEKDLQFTGKKLARVVGDAFKGRWIELGLYQTKSGKYICERVGCTEREGEVTRYEAYVVDTLDEVIDIFGVGFISKNLYDEAGIKVVDIVD